MSNVKCQIHIPVLQKEVIQYLNPKPNENFIDCTIGEGGHALSILERILPNGKLLGIDWSSEIIQELKIKNQKSEVKSNLIFVCDNFVNLKDIVKREKFQPVSGILFDLGMSSWHLEKSGRGFSFLRNEPLNMRYNLESQLTAEKIVNFWSQFELEKILKEYGEEKFAKRIAKEIVNQRKINPIKNTFQLVQILKKAVPKRYQRERISPATRTFQALRITVNDELNNLKKALPQAIDVLNRGGRLVVISFHSLEDRIVKNFFRKKTRENLIKILTKKPMTPSKEEIKINPRSRSAKLRAGLKL